MQFISQVALKPDGGKWTFSIITEKVLISIFSALYLSQHLLFSEVTQPFERNQKVNKGLTPSGSIVETAHTGVNPCINQSFEIIQKFFDTIGSYMLWIQKIPKIQKNPENIESGFQNPDPEFRIPENFDLKFS